MAYEYPYLSPHQSREPGADGMGTRPRRRDRGHFQKDARELDALVAALNASRVRPPSGGKWTAENFTAVMRDLGA